MARGEVVEPKWDQFTRCWVVVSIRIDWSRDSLESFYSLDLLS